MVLVNYKNTIFYLFIESAFMWCGQFGVSPGIDLESTERFEEPDRRHPRIQSTYSGFNPKSINLIHKFKPLFEKQFRYKAKAHAGWQFRWWGSCIFSPKVIDTYLHIILWKIPKWDVPFLGFIIEVLFEKFPYRIHLSCFLLTVFFLHLWWKVSLFLGRFCSAESRSCFTIFGFFRLCRVWPRAAEVRQPENVSAQTNSQLNSNSFC